ncbi:flavin reductase family protein [Streptomyces sp. NPDC051776]|uniref:flavin reductase family protein n=1 Tax=Streptomyces sp. NPDC051776 TaxID=3155414 RepID=UPI003418C031
MNLSTPVPDSVSFRAAAGRFPTGVVVITTTASAGPVGFTCQSFTSLSLEPALISFNVSRSSETWPYIQEAGSFCVNILASDQESVARSFAEKGSDRFSGVDHSYPSNSSPWIAGATAWLEATVERAWDGGDHLIVIGRVISTVLGRRDQALIYHQGDYSLFQERKPTAHP